ncbi:MAG: ComF family protein, partial [Actinomycetota bacterium]
MGNRHLGILRSLADLLYPENCAGCGIPARGGLCRPCLDAVARIDGPACGFCGYPIAAPARTCGQCRGRGFAFDRSVQAADFTGALRRAVHRYKYEGVTGLAGSLALLAREAALRLDAGEAVVTWIPASETRVIRRGVDHGALLAQRLGTLLEADVRGLIRRVRETPPQMALEPAERRTNLA